MKDLGLFARIESGPTVDAANETVFVVFLMKSVWKPLVRFVVVVPGMVIVHDVDDPISRIFPASEDDSVNDVDIVETEP